MAAALALIGRTLVAGLALVAAARAGSPTVSGRKAPGKQRRATTPNDARMLAAASTSPPLSLIHI